MTYILVIWQVVSIVYNGTTIEKRGWVSIGDFGTETRCLEAGRALGFDPKEIRCLRK